MDLLQPAKKKPLREKGLRAKTSTEVRDAESFGSSAERVKNSRTFATANATDDRRSQELEREIRDLKITNRAKDMFIEQLKGERAGFFEQLLSTNRTLGQLETKLQRLDERRQ